MAEMRRDVDVLAFWWDAGPEKWYERSDAFDQEIRDTFMATYEAAAAGKLDHWADTPSGTLALIILLDQLPRNMFRDDKRAFATDAKALGLARDAVAKDFDRAYCNPARQFFLMPYQHAEDLAVQEHSVDLFRDRCDQEGHYYALVHMDVIRRFGRFPHRNKVLGRQSTEAEQAFLDGGGFSA